MGAESEYRFVLTVDAAKGVEEARRAKKEFQKELGGIIRVSAFGSIRDELAKLEGASARVGKTMFAGMDRELAKVEQKVGSLASSLFGLVEPLRTDDSYVKKLAQDLEAAGIASETGMARTIRAVETAGQEIVDLDAKLRVMRQEWERRGPELVQGGAWRDPLLQAEEEKTRQALERMRVLYNEMEALKERRVKLQQDIAKRTSAAKPIELPPDAKGNLADIVRAELALGQAVTGTLKPITSQTTRLAANAKKLQELAPLVGAFAESERKLVAVLIATDARVQQEMARMAAEVKGRNPFQWLVQQAEKMFERIVGHSIVPDMVRGVLAWLERLKAGERGAFDPLVQEAEETRAAMRRLQTIPVSRPATGLQAQIDAEFYAARGMAPPYGTAVAPAAARPSFGQRIETFNQRLMEEEWKRWGMQRLGHNLAFGGRQMMMWGTALAGGLTLAGKSYADFNREADRAARNLELDADLTEAFTGKLLEMSRNMGLFTPEELAQGTYFWASGIGQVVKTEADLNEVLGQTMDIQKLAKMDMVDLGEATKGVVGILGEFGLSVDETRRVVEVLHYSAARSNAEVGDMVEAYKMVGPVAAQLNVSLEDTAALFTTLADANIKGTMAGRAVRQMFIQLLEPSKEAQEALGKLFGRDWHEKLFPRGAFVGTTRLIEMLTASLHGLTKAQQAETLAAIATANELPAITALVNDQTRANELGISMLRARGKEIDGVNDAEMELYRQEMARARGLELSTRGAAQTFEEDSRRELENVSIEWGRLEQKVGSVSKSLGKAFDEKVLPDLLKAADWLGKVAEKIEQNPDLIKVAAYGGAGLLAAGAIMNTVGNVVIMGTAASTMLAAAGTMKLAADEQLAAAGMGGVAKGGEAAAWGFGAMGLKGPGILGLLGKLVTNPITLGVGLGAGAEYAAGDWLRARLGLPKQDKGTVEMLFTPGVVPKLLEDMGTTLKQIDFNMRANWELNTPRSGSDAAIARAEADVRRQLLEEAYSAGLLVRPPDRAAGMKALGEALRSGATGWRAPAGVLGASVAGGGAPGGPAEWEQEALDAWQEYLGDREKLVSDANERLADLERDFAQSMVDFEADYVRERAKVLEDQAERAAEAEAKYRGQVEKVREDAQRRIEDIEEQHQERLQDIRQNYEDRMADAVRERDARAILDAQRQYDRERAKANDERGDQIRDAKRDRDRRLDELREAHDEERAERERDAERRLKEMDEQHTEEKARRLREYEERRQELKAELGQELTELETGNRSKLAALIGWQDQDEAARRAHYTRTLDDAQLRHDAGARAADGLPDAGARPGRARPGRPGADRPQHLRARRGPARPARAAGHRPRGGARDVPAGRRQAGAVMASTEYKIGLTQAGMQYVEDLVGGNRPRGEFVRYAKEVIGSSGVVRGHGQPIARWTFSHLTQAELNTLHGYCSSGGSYVPGAAVYITTKADDGAFHVYSANMRWPADTEEKRRFGRYLDVEIEFTNLVLIV